MVALRSITARPNIHRLSNAYSSPTGLHDSLARDGKKWDRAGLGMHRCQRLTGCDNEWLCGATLCSHLNEETMSTVKQPPNGQNSSDSYVMRVREGQLLTSCVCACMCGCVEYSIDFSRRLWCL